MHPSSAIWDTSQHKPLLGSLLMFRKAIENLCVELEVDELPSSVCCFDADAGPVQRIVVLFLKIVAWRPVHSPPRQYLARCGQKIGQRVGIPAGMEFRSSVSRGGAHTPYNGRARRLNIAIVIAAI